MILLDTNAILWLLAEHPRAAPLLEIEERSISPVSMLELKYLIEAGRIQVAEGSSLNAIIEDPRWQLDSPTSEELFATALDLEWTRDPFDRLLAAHAILREWPLATGDRNLIANLDAEQLMSL